MFVHLAGQAAIGVPPEAVVAVIESINTPSVSLPDIGTGSTKCYLVGVVSPNGGYGIFCYMLFLESNVPVVYISNPPEVGIEHYGELEANAIQFAESLGFMLDNMNFRAQPPDEQARLIDTLPFFRIQEPARRTSASSIPGAAPAAAEAYAVARLLSSF